MVANEERLERVRESLYSDNGQTAYSELLKPCPFCGGQPFAQVHEWSYSAEARVVCSKCHVATSYESVPYRITDTRTGEDLTRLDAIGAAICKWNERVG